MRDRDVKEESEGAIVEERYGEAKVHTDIINPVIFVKKSNGETTLEYVRRNITRLKKNRLFTALIQSNI